MPLVPLPVAAGAAAVSAATAPRAAGGPGPRGLPGPVRRPAPCPGWRPRGATACCRSRLARTDQSSWAVHVSPTDPAMAWGPRIRHCESLDLTPKQLRQSPIWAGCMKHLSLTHVNLVEVAGSGNSAGVCCRPQPRAVAAAVARNGHAGRPPRLRGPGAQGAGQPQQHVPGAPRCPRFCRSYSRKDSSTVSWQ